MRYNPFLFDWRERERKMLNFSRAQGTLWGSTFRSLASQRSAGMSTQASALKYAKRSSPITLTVEKASVGAPAASQVCAASSSQPHHFPRHARPPAQGCEPYQLYEPRHRTCLSPPLAQGWPVFTPTLHHPNHAPNPCLKLVLPILFLAPNLPHQVASQRSCTKPAFAIGAATRDLSLSLTPARCTP